MSDKTTQIRIADVSRTNFMARPAAKKLIERVLVAGALTGIGGCGSIVNQYYIINPDAGPTDSRISFSDSQTNQDSPISQDSSMPSDASCGFVPGGMLRCGESRRITLLNGRIEPFGNIGLRLDDIQRGRLNRALLTELVYPCIEVAYPAVRQGSSRESYYNGESLTITADQVHGGFTYGISFATLIVQRNCGRSAPDTTVDAGSGCRLLTRNMINQGEGLVLSLPFEGPDRLNLDDLEIDDQTGDATALLTFRNFSIGSVSDAFGQAENQTLRRSLTNNDQYEFAITSWDVQAGYQFIVKRADIAVSLCSVERDAGSD